MITTYVQCLLEIIGDHYSIRHQSWWVGIGVRITPNPQRGKLLLAEVKGFEQIHRAEKWQSLDCILNVWLCSLPCNRTFKLQTWNKCKISSRPTSGSAPHRTFYAKYLSVPHGPLGLSLFLKDPKQNIPILVCTLFPHHSVPTDGTGPAPRRKTGVSQISLLLPLGPAVTDTKPLVWGSNSSLADPAKSAQKSRGYKACFPRIALKSPLGKGCKGAREPPLQSHFHTLWQDGSSSRRPPLEVHAHGLLPPLIYILVLILYPINLLSYLISSNSFILLLIIWVFPGIS